MTAKKYDRPESEFDINARTAMMALLIFAIIGFWLRAIGLGYAPLAEDEYYFITSTHNVLEKGIPLFDSGGYYIRGILQQYLTAFTIIVFGDDTFAYRFPPLLFGTGTCIMTYFLGRQFMSRTWSILLVAILTLSSWQIEFSRFARMYALLQFLTVSFFWLLYRVLPHGLSKIRYLPLLIAALSLSAHRLGFFLTLFAFYPIPFWHAKDIRTTLRQQKYYIGLSCLLLMAGLYLATHGFRYEGVSHHLPADYIPPEPRSLAWYYFSAYLFGSNLFLFFGAVGSALIFTGGLIYLWRQRLIYTAEDMTLIGILTIALCASIFHQFAMSFLCLTIVLLRNQRFVIHNPNRYLFLAIVALFIFWTAMLFTNSNWVQAVGLGDSLRSYLRSFRLALFSFPDLYTPVFRAWADNIPVLGVLLTVSAALQLFAIRKGSALDILKNPVTVMVILIIALGIRPPYKIETRYTFFIYPIFLCVAFLSATRLQTIIAQRFKVTKTAAHAGTATLCLLLFIVTEDFNPAHIFNISSDTSTFRLGQYGRFEKHWYPRWDFQTPADFVNRRKSPLDRVIVSHKVNTAGAYLDNEFAVFWPRSDAAFPAISREQGRLDIWSNQRLLSTLEDLDRYGADAHKIWIVLYRDDDDLRAHLYELWSNKIKLVESHKPGRDKKLEIMSIVF